MPCAHGRRERHPAASPSWRRGKKSLLIRRDATLPRVSTWSLSQGVRMTSWTPVQQKRLKELNAGKEQLEKTFETPSERDRAYQALERSLVQAGKKHLEELRTVHRRPVLCRLEDKLIHVLT